MLKEAAGLSEAGFEVTVFAAAGHSRGRKVDHDLARSHGFRYVDVMAPSGRGRVHVTWPRVRNKLGHAAYRLVRFSNHWQLGLCGPELLVQALRDRADFYSVHLEQALWVGKRLMRAGCRVGIDMEDWYSEDLLPAAQEARPIGLLRSLEGDLLRSAKCSSCPSQAMSETLGKEFECPPPTVIYNAFPWADRRSIDGKARDRLDHRVPSIHWYSQTLGNGRGLEDLVAALPHVKCKGEIHLRGNPMDGFEQWLATRVPVNWRKHVFIHRQVANEELLSRVAEHDIGFAGEMKFCRSRDLTVTNKILHYLLAGLAVVASDTAGQREVAGQSEHAISLYRAGDPMSLAEQLNGLLENPERLGRAKFDALRAAERIFCWERQAPKLLKGVEIALS